MDHLTVDGEVVLVSLGGRPQMPEARMERVEREKQDVEKRGEAVGDALDGGERDARREAASPFEHHMREYTSEESSNTGTDRAVRSRKGGQRDVDSNE